MRILYLYHDLLNLYGESGNIRALERRLTDQGEQVEVIRRTLGDELNFENVDMVYVGAGTERSQKAALQHLLTYRNALKDALDSGMHALFTGNAGTMLAREIVDGNGKVWQGLGLADFTAHEQKERRYNSDVIAQFDEIEKPLVGFVNYCDLWDGEVVPLFHMVMGRGNREDSREEGLRLGNLLATHLIGPVLVKNPGFHSWLVERLIGHTPVQKEYPYEEKAWQVTYDALIAQREQN